MERIYDRQPDKHEKLMKKAWIIKETTVISFHEVERAELFEAGETEFWEHILCLINHGYKVQ